VSGQKADVCLILEGTYPYVTGGVSHWCHSLLKEQSHLSFHLCAIVPRDSALELQYDLPSNVVGLTTVSLNDLPKGAALSAADTRGLHRKLRAPIANMTSPRPMEMHELEQMIEVLHSYKNILGTEALLDREEAWQQLVDLYEASFPEHSFLDFFWSYRAIIGSVYSVLLADLPQADIYHALSTGYAGLMASRAKIETGKACFVTEHGIYTNERRIEVNSADWLDATSSKALTIDHTRRDLRDMWIDAINNFSHLCYQGSDQIITLFKGNQQSQIVDGADPSKMGIIPNGVDLKHFKSIVRTRDRSRATIAFIGRVVPIKDVKSFLRAVALIKQTAPDIQALVIGSSQEDPEYYKECVNLAHLLGIDNNVEFTGHARIEDYLPHIDLLVLTSISEAQPLVMLEAGACGIPIVATDAGACREIIEGTEEETPSLGHGGIVTSMASPAATANAIYQLLSDDALYENASKVIQARITEYYNMATQLQAYRNLYAQHLRASS
jgi:glycosyltransferase involved in cell wall biosynthesis